MGCGVISHTSSSQDDALISQFQRGKNPIGRGGFGEVYLCVSTLNGQLFVAKKIKVKSAVPGGDKQTRRALQTLQVEINTMRQLRHKHVVRYLGSQCNTGSFYIFMEYVPGGSLSDLLTQFSRLHESVVTNYTKQILLGIEFLHRKGFVHRDVKPGNLLVSVDGTIKMADFGTAVKLGMVIDRDEVSDGREGYDATRLTTDSPFNSPTLTDSPPPSSPAPFPSTADSLSSGGSHHGESNHGSVHGSPDGTGSGKGRRMQLEAADDQVGTITHFAPERITDRLIGRQTDIWAVGCTVLEMLTGKRPYAECFDRVSLWYNIGRRGHRPEVPDSLSENAKSFLTLCFMDTDRRPSASDLLQHPFIRPPSTPASVTSPCDPLASSTRWDPDGSGGDSPLSPQNGSNGHHRAGSSTWDNGSGSYIDTSEIYHEQDQMATSDGHDDEDDHVHGPLVLPKVLRGRSNHMADDLASAMAVMPAVADVHTPSSMLIETNGFNANTLRQRLPSSVSDKLDVMADGGVDDTMDIIMMHDRLDSKKQDDGVVVGHDQSLPTCVWIKIGMSARMMIRGAKRVFRLIAKEDDSLPLPVSMTGGRGKVLVASSSQHGRSHDASTHSPILPLHVTRSNARATSWRGCTQSARTTDIKPNKKSAWATLSQTFSWLSRPTQGRDSDGECEDMDILDMHRPLYPASAVMLAVLLAVTFTAAVAMLVSIKVPAVLLSLSQLSSGGSDASASSSGPTSHASSTAASTAPSQPFYRTVLTRMFDTVARDDGIPASASPFGRSLKYVPAEPTPAAPCEYWRSFFSSSSSALSPVTVAIPEEWDADEDLPAVHASTASSSSIGARPPPAVRTSTVMRSLLASSVTPTPLVGMMMIFASATVLLMLVVRRGLSPSRPQPQHQADHQSTGAPLCAPTFVPCPAPCAPVTAPICLITPPPLSCAPEVVEAPPHLLYVDTQQRSHDLMVDEKRSSSDSVIGDFRKGNSFRVAQTTAARGGTVAMPVPSTVNRRKKPASCPFGDEGGGASAGQIAAFLHARAMQMREARVIFQDASTPVHRLS